MKTYTETREQYQARFQAAQDEVADYQATGIRCPEARRFLSKLPPIANVQENVRVCVSIGNSYNLALVAIGAALRHAKDRQQADAFCGLWDRKCGHSPYISNIRKLLLGPILSRIHRSNPEVTANNLQRVTRWLYHQAQMLA
jgi:hypothetical protein